jgi:hypothetical protein
MTLLNPTPDELRARHEARLADLAERARRWQGRRRRFVHKVTLAGALLLGLGAWLAAFGGSMAWPCYALLPPLGALLAWLIAWVPLGILRGMLAYGIGSFLGWLLCALSGWWQPANGAGGLVLMMMAWLAWIVVGGVLGMLSEQFDNDQLQV